MSLGMRLAAFAVVGSVMSILPLPTARADVKRRLLEHPDPEYPTAAKRLGVQGSVILRIVIDPDGHVSDVRVASGDPLLVDAAKAAAQKWKYSPATESTISVVQISFSK